MNSLQDFILSRRLELQPTNLPPTLQIERHADGILDTERYPVESRFSLRHDLFLVGGAHDLQPSGIVALTYAYQVCRGYEVRSDSGINRVGASFDHCSMYRLTPYSTAERFVGEAITIVRHRHSLLFTIQRVVV